MTKKQIDPFFIYKFSIFNHFIKILEQTVLFLQNLYHELFHYWFDLLVHMKTVREMLMYQNIQLTIDLKELNQYPYISLVHNMLNFVLIWFLQVADKVFWHRTTCSNFLLILFF